MAWSGGMKRLGFPLLPVFLPKILPLRQIADHLQPQKQDGVH